MNQTIMLLPCITFFFLMVVRSTSSSLDIIAVYQNITDGQSIVSENKKLEMGFFSPGGSSKNRYLGIWFKNASPRTVVWVANRETPLMNTMGIVKLDIHGILSLFNGGGTVIWSSNSSASGLNIVNNPVTQLLDTGNLVTKDGNIIIWQSFDYPGDTLLQGMKIGKNLITGRETYLTSWRSADDPSPGEYTVRFLMIKGKYQQLYIFKNSSVIETRIGPYNGVGFAGLPNYKPNPFYVYKFEMVVNEKEMYLMYTYSSISSTYSVRALATPGGKLEVWHLNMRNGEWTQDLWLPIDNCDIYGPCGPYGSCSTLTNPNCGCLKGFEQKNPQELSPDNWTSGCRRSRALDCGPREGFLKFSSMKLPDTQNAEFDGNMSLQECEVACKNNCSCTAYANPNMTSGGVGCLLWFGELIDVRVYPQNGQDLYVRVAASELLELHSSFHRKKRASIRIILAISAGLVVLGLLILALYIRSKKRRSDMERQDDIRKPLLDWPCRFHIIHGIAQGLLYLHQDSRLRVVHRDLKAGNILLDHDMNPKISDFGLARMFKEHESEAKTKRVVGTLGYISPEYATNGLFSVKSDIFSFGVLVLEIVSGNRSRGFVHEDHHDNLLEHAWRLYKAGKSLDLIDTSLGNSWCISEALQSIHIGLLCVQQRAEDRPSTRSVVGMLGGEVHYLLPSNLGSLSMGVKGTT